VYDNGGINPDDLNNEQPQGLINEVYRTLVQSIPAGITQASVKYQVPDEMLYALRENVFIFSGMKTYHQLKEASQMLVTDTGEIKPFDKFNRDVQKIYGEYNQRYLEAEYGFAVHSAQMAVKWNDYAQDGDTYNLQYRTAGDDRVRAEHVALNGTTLPPSDPFWNSYMPPLDWGCRCTVVQVLKEKYTESNSAEAQELGKKATTRIGADGTNKLAMFRFNPGKALKIFPDKHPYFPRGCDNCDKNIRLAATIDKNELCKVCSIVRKQAKKSAIVQEREKYLKEMEPLLNRTVVKKVDGNKQISIKFTKKGNKHLYHDTTARVKGLFDKNELKNLDSLLRKATFDRQAGLYKARKDDIKKFYYFKDKDKELYYNVAEKIYKRKGIQHTRHFLYAITIK